jgi:hypothetical protein
MAGEMAWDFAESENVRTGAKKKESEKEKLLDAFYGS